MIYVGTAGWSLPREAAKRFPKSGSHLERYSQVLNCAEINSSFYRSHARETYARWARSTPDNFKFAVKVPQTITHDARLRRTRTPLEQFLGETKGLGRKLGPFLIQLPPSLIFDARVASRFFSLLRERHRGPIVCEPRHVSWFEPSADRVMVKAHIARVAADPAVLAVAAGPGAARSVAYFRLHGSPRMYWSNYSPEFMRGLMTLVSRAPKRKPVWIIFDNTAAGCATANAVQLRKLLRLNADRSR